MRKASVQIMTLLLTLCLALPAVSAATIPADVEGTNYEQAVTELLQFHIITGYEDGSFQPENTLTRAEFSAIIIRALGLEDAISTVEGQTQFTDVPAGYWGAGYINMAQQMGIINGYGDGRFGPDDKVTGVQTLKMLVCALGYQVLAEQNGGYPNGYLSAAGQIRLMAGADFDYNQPISRGNAAIVVQNAMDVEILEPDYSGEGSMQTTGETLMSKLCDMLDLEEKQGIVTNDGITGLTQESTINPDRISIDGEVYDLGSESAQGLLGYSVTFYVERDTDVIYSIVKDRKNETLTIRAEDISEVSGTEIRYVPSDNRSGSARRAPLSADVPTIYNGRYFKDAAPQDWQNETGSLTLLDNNGDGNYDVVFVKDYVNYMAGGTEGTHIKLKVFSDNGDSRFLGNDYIDTEDTEITVRTLDKDGAEIALSEIKADQILSVYASKDGKYVSVVPSSETISGTVEELSVDGDAVIDGKTYPMAKNTKGAYLALLQPGDEGTFWLDADGYLTAMHVTRVGYDVQSIDDEMITSYLLDLDPGNALGETVRLKVLSNLRDGTRRENIFTLSRNVSLDGEKMEPAEVADILMQDDSIGCPILYKINGSQEITKLYRFESAGDSAARVYSEANRAFDTMYSLDDDTIAYFVDPQDDSEVYDNADVKLQDGKRYQVQVFDPSDAMMIDEETVNLRNRIFVISVYLAGVEQTDTDMPMLVQSVSQSLDSGGDIRYTVKGLSGEEMVSYPLSEDVQNKASRIQLGSLMTYTLNGLGEIKSFKVVAQVPSDTTYRRGIGGENERLYGNVLNLENNADYSSCILTVEYQANGETQSIAYEIADKPIYVYARSSQKVEPGTLNDITSGAYAGASEVLVYTVNFEVSCVVAVR